jgi:DeoR/GlpR family transcriptional regulator of sugar metabolism
MFKNQRHEEILKFLKENGFASVKELSERMYASLPTIRRDLDYLQREGLIHRSHGGAIAADEKRKAPVSFRTGTSFRQKARICRVASELIRHGNIIFTDASTTVTHLVDFINEKDDVTVITNGYPICRLLADKNIRTYSTGGRLLKSSMVFVGNSAEDTINKFNADLFFFSSSSLDENGIISDYSEEEIALRKLMFERSYKKVFLFDSKKFATRSAYRSFPLSQIDHIITDAVLPKDLLEQHHLSLYKRYETVMWYVKT